MQKKWKIDWKKARTGVILLTLYAGNVCTAYGSEPEKTGPEQKNLAKDELGTAVYYAAENQALRKELIETLDKYSTQAGQLRRIQMGAAGTIETLEPVYTGAREMELAADLQQCMESMKKMSAAVMAFSDEFEKNLSDLPAGNTAAVKLRIQLDALKAQAQEQIRLTTPAKSPSKNVACRVLELDTETKLVILSGGYRDGVRVGMILNSKDVKLKVIAIRNFVSAAVILEGAEEKLAVGATVSAGVQER